LGGKEFAVKGGEGASFPPKLLSSSLPCCPKIFKTSIVSEHFYVLLAFRYEYVGIPAAADVPLLLSLMLLAFLLFNIPSIACVSDVAVDHVFSDALLMSLWSLLLLAPLLFLISLLLLAFRCCWRPAVSGVPAVASILAFSWGSYNFLAFSAVVDILAVFFFETMLTKSLLKKLERRLSYIAHIKRDTILRLYYILYDA
jgi:hypothetical protein